MNCLTCIVFVWRLEAARILCSHKTYVRNSKHFDYFDVSSGWESYRCCSIVIFIQAVTALRRLLLEIIRHLQILPCIFTAFVKTSAIKAFISPCFVSECFIACAIDPGKSSRSDELIIRNSFGWQLLVHDAGNPPMLSKGIRGRHCKLYRCVCERVACVYPCAYVYASISSQTCWYAGTKYWFHRIFLK